MPRFRRIVFEQFEDRRLLAVANDDAFSAFGPEMIQGNVWSNDTYNGSWTSLQYDYVTEEWYYQDEYAYWQILNQPASGTLNALAEGYFEFTPDENSTLPSDAFTYQICDDSSCASATVTLQFNQPPVANLDEFSVAMGAR